MYAIFEAKGKQFRAVPDQKLRVPSLAAEPGDRVTFDTVLLAQAGETQDVLIGQPALDGASVAVEVLRHGRDDKIVVYKMKRRKGYRRKQGHRQGFTEVRVVDIQVGTGKSKKAKAAPKPLLRRNPKPSRRPSRRPPRRSRRRRSMRPRQRSSWQPRLASTWRRLPGRGRMVAS